MKFSKVAVYLAVATLGLVKLIEVSAAQTTPCVNPRLRREIRDLSDDERNRFFRAIRAIQVRPQANKPSKFDIISYYHNGWAKYTHSVPPFLPYHRLMLDLLEKELQKVDPTIMLPYWDWSLDSQAPELSPLLTPTWFGTNGKGSKMCLQDGFYRDFKPFYRAANQPEGCIQRIFDGGKYIKPFASPELIEDMISKSRNFAELRSWIEGYPHGRVHNGLGGTMKSMYSPNDPIFYMHHAMIDKIWYDWQARDPKNRVYQYYGYDSSTKRNVTLNQFLPPPFTKRRVGDGMNVRAGGMCYKYAPPVKALARNQKTKRSFIADVSTPSSISCNTTINATVPMVQIETEHYTQPPSYDDRSFIMELRAPPPIPDDWIKMNNLDVELIRVQEQRANELCDQLNRVEGYLSPAALWNRSDMLEKLTKTVSEFKAHINNKLVRVKSTNVEQLRTIFKRAGVKIIETLSMRKDVLERAAQHSKLTLERIVASTKNLWRKLVRADQHNTSKSIEKCKRTQ